MKSCANFSWLNLLIHDEKVGSWPFSLAECRFNSSKRKGATMVCVRSVAVHDSELLAYIAGDADSALTAHIANCGECQQRAVALTALEQRLTTSLYRLACPSPLALGEYELGLLEAADARAVAFHLQHCPHCATEIANLTTYLAAVAPTIELEPTLPLVERTRILVAHLVEQLSPLGALGGLTPATAGVRGAAGAQLVYTVEDVEVIIDIQVDLQYPDQRMILGLVLGLPAAQTVTAHLWRMDRSVTTTTVDDLGNFVMEALTPGAYDLILSSDKNEVHIQNLLV